MKNFINANFVVDELDFIILVILPNEIQAYIQSIIAGIYFGGGLNSSPIFTRMYEAFLTGGIPCGWVGPLPEEGGDPLNCIQLLHFATHKIT